MRTNQTLILLTGLALMLGSSGCLIVASDSGIVVNRVKQRDLHESEVQTEETVLQGVSVLHVTTHNGRIAYRGEAGREDMAVTVRKMGGGFCPSDAEAALAAIDTQYDVSPNGVARLSWRWAVDEEEGWRARVAYEIVGPQGVDLDFETHNGAVKVESVVGEVVTETHNGSIEVEGISGTIHAKTHNGRIQANGEVPHAILITHNGSVEAHLIGSPTVEGKIVTHNGQIVLGLDDKVETTLDCRTTNGRVIAKELTFSTVKTDGQRELEASVNGGGPDLEIRTRNGNIRVSRN
jgi:hypothetical protein